LIAQLRKARERLLDLVVQERETATRQVGLRRCGRIRKGLLRFVETTVCEERAGIRRRRCGTTRPAKKYGARPPHGFSIFKIRA
jgi:hypothetical protein